MSAWPTSFWNWPRNISRNSTSFRLANPAFHPRSSKEIPLFSFFCVLPRSDLRIRRYREFPGRTNRLKSENTNPYSVPTSPSRDGFRALVEQHQSRVYSIAFRILGDRGTAE